MTTNLFSLDFGKDSKLIGKTYTLIKAEVDEEGDPIQKDLRAKLVDIDRDGYYTFKVTTPRSELEEFRTRVPNCGDVEK